MLEVSTEMRWEGGDGSDKGMLMSPLLMFDSWAPVSFRTLVSPSVKWAQRLPLLVLIAGTQRSRGGIGRGEVGRAS